MADALDHSALSGWQQQPTRFIQEVLRDPETGKPFQLLDAERAFLAHAFKTDDSARLVHPEQLYACPKKSGKTGFAAMHLLTTTLVFGGKFAEGYAIANDLEQAQGRVFQAVKRICECSPHLRRECDVTLSRITFPETGATIQAIGSDYAGAAGANPVISSFDELWGYVSERSRRWKISKEKASHKIDVVVALGMAALAAVKSQSEPFFDNSFDWVSGRDDNDPDPDGSKAWRQLRLQTYINSGGTRIL